MLQKMTACGRKRTFDFVDFGASERPLWRKADIPEYPQDFHKIDQFGRPLYPRKRTLSWNESKGPLTTDTVEKLRFEINGDFICDLSVILFSMYEGVVEVR